MKPLPFLWALLAGCALAVAAKADDVPLKVMGAGVRDVKVVEQLPAFVSAPLNDQSDYAWKVPAGVAIEEPEDINAPGNEIKIVKAPKGDITIGVVIKTWTYDDAAKKWKKVNSAGKIVLSVGGVAPTPPPGPPDPPPPPSPVSKLSILLVKDAKADSPDRLRLLAQAKAVLESKGHTCFVRTFGQASLAASGFGQIPADTVVLISDGAVRSSTKLPATLPAILDIVKAAGGLTAPEVMTEDGKPYIEIGGHRRYLTAMPTPLATRRLFATYGDNWPTIPESQWQDFSITELLNPRILDQDGRGACVGHGSVGAFETHWRLNAHVPVQFDPWFTYGQINGGSDNGAVVGDSLKSMQSTGVSLWGIVPYGEYRASRMPASAREAAKRFHPDIVYWTPSWEEICSAVQRGHPVVFGTEIGGAFNPNADGVIPDQRGGGGGHCMHAVGLKKINGQWYLHVQNSWSTNWGKGGFCYMPKSYFRDRTETADAYALVSPAEDPQDTLPLPKVRTSSRKAGATDYAMAP